MSIVYGLLLMAEDSRALKAVGLYVPHLFQSPLWPLFKILLKIPFLHGTSLFTLC